MHLKSMYFNKFKRFTDMRVEELPANARLIILAGPNGCGKSSFFDGLRTWHIAHGGTGGIDESYISKAGMPNIGWPERVSVEFHESGPQGADELKKLVYARSAFRNDADFNINSFSRVGSPLDRPRVNRMIDNDTSVADNYQQLIMASIDGLYDDSVPDDTPKKELRERIIGRVQASMVEVFPDLQIVGVGGITVRNGQSEGTFYFAKGTSRGFLYKNLSGGEKAAFDLLLDAVIKGEYFDNSIWCIDEPETHLNTRVQARLLKALMALLPKNSQLILASHSIGFMRGAWEMSREESGSVIFLDMDGHDFDGPVTLRPIAPSRDFWTRTLDVALGDLAKLMAPEHLVLCEGRPASDNTRGNRAEFDASCYRKIFSAEFPNTDFLSVGNSSDVQSDRLEAGKTIQTIASGTRITRLIDCDMRTEREVQELANAGVRVLSRRNIESYLLDDEVLSALCISIDRPEQIPEILAIKTQCLAESIARGNPADDYKKSAPETYNRTRMALQLTRSGSNWTAFAQDILSPLFAPGMSVYEELKADIFGD